MSKVNNIIKIDTSLDTNFFYYWLLFTKPLHGLTLKEILILSSLIKRRYILSKVIKDDSVLDKHILDSDSKRIVTEECDIKRSHLNVILGSLKLKGIILDDRINPKFIPSINIDTDNQDSFQLLVVFNFNNGD